MNNHILYSVVCIWILLILASLIVFVLSKLKPEKDFTELAKRTKSWWIMLAMFSLAMFINRSVSYIFLGFISFVALKEYFTMIETRRTDRRVLFWAYLSIPFQFYWAATSWFGMFIIFIPVYAFLFIPFRMVLTQNTEGFLKSVGTIHWGLMTCVFSLSHMALLLSLPATVNNDVGGVGLLLVLAFLTQFNDVSQYISGKLFGRHKIMPIISPKKTCEGLAGGIILTTLASIIISPHLTPFSLQFSVLSGLIISISGFIGDITISAIKRDIGIKDTGNLIPGHGGILDRIDSLTFTAPLFFHLVYYFYY